MMETNIEKVTFKSLGVVDVLCETCERLKWLEPSRIQQEAIPVALAGRDIIGLAETGSGKTGAFALPIVQSLLVHQTKLFALVLTPTRELAIQIAEQFEALGASINLKCAVIIGGIDVKTQRLMLEKRPHIIIATPGRMRDHLKNMKGFNLKSLKYLVLDEADRLLNLDFEEEVDAILSVIPRERNTYLFSATMTKKVAKLQRASQRNPVHIEVSDKFQTVSKLVQKFLLVPEKFKFVYLVYLMNELDGKSTIIFCNTCKDTQKTALCLNLLGFSAIPLHGQLSQNQRQGLLNQFRSKDKNILVATDVVARGLDIPHVDVVINLYVPVHSKEYIHRVGRTARAGREGLAFTFATQDDAEQFIKITQQLGYEMEKYTPDKEEVMVYKDTVEKARNMAEEELADNVGKGKKRKSSVCNIPVQKFKKKKY